MTPLQQKIIERLNAAKTLIESSGINKLQSPYKGSRKGAMQYFEERDKINILIAEIEAMEEA